MGVNLTGISLGSKGDYAKTLRFLQKSSKGNLSKLLNKFGRDGVAALESATPVDSSETASSWSYIVQRSKGVWSIEWSNGHVVDGVPVAILLQYGHGTGTGGFVQGRDYINPAIQPVFDRLADNVWKAVTSV